ncbi:MAG: sugar O-acetyltransferase [Psychromonas sp.]
MLEKSRNDDSASLLRKHRQLVKTMCHRFNMADPTQPGLRMNILHEQLNIKGQGNIKPNFFCSLGYNIYLGENFHANHNLYINDVYRVEIGNNVMFGPNVIISAAITEAAGKQQSKPGLPVKVGNNVWFGGNVSVSAGVSIGDNCVIGAGSVVKQDIPGNTVAVGNPCRVIKQI